MANIKKVFDELNKKIITDDKRFLIIQSENKKIIVLDFEAIKHIELDIEYDQIWIGTEIFIHYKNLNYENSIEEFYALLIDKWMNYKRSIN